MKYVSARFVPCSRSTYVIAVTGYEEKNISGALYCPALDLTLPFSNLMQLFFRMEDLMDRLNAPQRSMRQRTFQAAPRDPEPDPLPPADSCTPLASFSVSVLFRQNASWQGNLVWTDAKLESSFRSALELAGLLDEALTLALRRQGESVPASPPSP